MQRVMLWTALPAANKYGELRRAASLSEKPNLFFKSGTALRYSACVLQKHHGRTNFDAVVEINNMVVQKPNAAV